MRWLPEYIDDYATAHTQVGESELLEALERKTHFCMVYFRSITQLAGYPL